MYISHDFSVIDDDSSSSLSSDGVTRAVEKSSAPVDETRGVAAGVFGMPSETAPRATAELLQEAGVDGSSSKSGTQNSDGKEEVSSGGKPN
ncbi:hypothetical protein Trco_008400 [Trichoderma cornu-damae]|uniref:Uncharacterized protein n=1 Tax=Trichoderma cornu-damae TaxID=654480 RepID=A0A9P8QFC5_9HYPO|nr:hypothetical protein Trco_008400 [Trichoderma cornu-damae]